jgi:hypothetical protein
VSAGPSGERLVGVHLSPPTVDPHSSHESRSTLSVGGPGGIVIETHARASVAHTPTRPPVELTSLVGSHPLIVAAALTTSALGALVVPAVVIHLLALPWLFEAPAVVAALFIALGAVAVLRRSRPAPRDTASLEHCILDLAVHRGGTLTIADTAHALRISLADADAALTAVARAGHADVANDPLTGTVLFRFQFAGTPQPAAALDRPHGLAKESIP